MVASPDPNATGAPTPLPGTKPGDRSRESHERQAAAARADARAARGEAEPSDLDYFARLRPHELFTILAENVRDYAVFLMDRDGIIRYWGEGARLMKWWAKDQTVGSHLRMLYPDWGAEDGTAEEHLETAARTGEYTGEGLRLRGDGSTFWAGVTLTALHDDAGELIGFVKVTRDFSARRAIEAALRAGQEAVEAQQVAEEANRLKTLFIASVTHEIRTPLNAMMGFLQMLARETERQQAHVARVLSSGTQLLHVVDDVLDISRLEAGRFPVDSIAARLADAVRAAVEDIEQQAAEKGVRVANELSGSAGETPYWGDPVRVRQIILNVLSNAVKYTPAGGDIVVSGGSVETAPDSAGLVGPGPWVYVRVEDTGQGIPGERLAAVFEPFEQARISDAVRGAGLGLSISRRLARLMGGDLTVTSEVGSGSAFVLWLPLARHGHVPR